MLVGDAQRLFAEGLAGALRAHSDLEVAGSYPTNGAEVIDAIRRLRPDVALLDYWMPDTEGPALAARVVARFPGCKVLLVSWLFGPAQVQLSLQAGAVGFFPKSMTLADVVEGIRRAHAGERPVFRDRLQDLVGELDERGHRVSSTLAALASLTDREQQVLEVLAMGHSIESGSEKLFISQSTFKGHVSRILEKTGQARIRQVIAMARYSGWFRD